jgi:PKD repeat protein
MVGSALAQPVCTPSFTWTPSPSGNNLLKVIFTNTSTFSFPPTATTVAYSSINFGDNTSGTIPNAGNTSHNYSAPGTYNVVLTTYAYDSLTQTQLCNNTYSQSVTVAYTACGFTISATNNGSGSFTFTLNNPAATSGMSYNWNFGDGSTATGTATTQTHTYVNSGTYMVSVSGTGGGCLYSNSVSIQYAAPVNCSLLNASFSYNMGTGGQVYFSNQSTFVNSNPPVVRVPTWDFGDGSPLSTSLAPAHTYAASGLYNVILYNNWVDTFTNAVLCSDTDAQVITVTIAPQANVISGLVIGDSANAPTTQVSYKVWLIVHNATANTLTAVDSVVATGVYAAYSFSNPAAGNYLTKAAVVNGTPGITGMIPTYHDSSLYWNMATTIVHNGGTTSGKHIYMQQGLTTSGPGFIGGNISQGANKGTNAGVPNLLVMLRNSANDLVKFTYTDLNGDYSFGALPAGTYNVYPEDMNYLTTPSSGITLASGAYSVNGVNFKQTPTVIVPITTGLQDVPSANMFGIYPNPTKGNVSISWSSTMTGKATVSIMDMAGRQVYAKDADVAKMSSLDLSRLQSGIYFISITTDKAQHTEKIILQH